MRAEWRVEKVLSSGVTGLKSQFFKKSAKLSDVLIFTSKNIGQFARRLIFYVQLTATNTLKTSDELALRDCAGKICLSNRAAHL
jgi:hypothetical protein